MPKKIQLIVASTRQNRIADSIATWLVPELQKQPNIELEVVDLLAVNLPFFNAPISPMREHDSTEAGIAWGKQIAGADGYIFLTAEYNRSIPASLKNALDYLYEEWQTKPAGIISYGWTDGGMGASRHLIDIATCLKMHVVEPQVHLRFSGEIMNEQEHITAPLEAFAAYNESIATLAHTLDQFAVPVVDMVKASPAATTA